MYLNRDNMIIDCENSIEDKLKMTCMIDCMARFNADNAFWCQKYLKKEEVARLVLLI